MAPEQPGGPVLLTGRILTVGPVPTASAVLMHDGRIEAVGGREVQERALELGAVRRDLPGRLIVPGFVDPHVHLEHLAVGRGRAVDCRVPGCKTVGEVLEALSAGLEQRPGEWLIGYGNLFFDQKLAERRLPTRQELDRVSDSVPIVLHLGGHGSVLNTRALEAAEVDRFLTGSPGAWGSPVVDLDSAGEPTGLVGEIDPFLPIPAPSRAERSSYVETAFGELFTANGVTAFGEMVEEPIEVDILDELISTGRLAARAVLYAMVPALSPLGEAATWAAGYKSRAGPERLRAGGVKLFADGGYSARNAATRTPYVAAHAPEPGYRGRLNLRPAQLAEAIAVSRSAGVQLAVHANGTRAQDEVLAAVRAAGEVRTGQDQLGRPVRVEHLGNVLSSPSDIATWREAGVVPVVQPAFLYNFIGDFLPMLLGAAASRGLMPLRSLIAGGMRPAFSSDVALGAEEGQSAPMFAIWAAMARRSYFDRHVEPEEEIGFEEALRLHTIEAAAALGAESELGSIETGKRADVVVLERDPRTVATEQVRDVRVDAVYLAGDEVYRRPASS
jgi:hypothetical protein